MIEECRRNGYEKIFGCFLTIMILGTLGGCGKQDTQEPPKVEIDYGNSELYTQEDMDAAIQVIEAEFATWEGCELHSLFLWAATRPAATKTLSGSTGWK